jgi:ribosomal-protein-alanine N-acetyltransferase
METERLWLRELCPEILENLFSTATDEEIIDFLGLRSLKELEVEKEKMKKGVVTFNRSFKNFQLIDRATNKIIGNCGFHTWMLQHNRAEIGYSLFDDQWKGKGFMTEAFQAIINFGFEEMKLHRIEALIGANNTPSLKLVKRMGFIEEGTLREHYLIDNVYEDSLVFSLLKNEYEKIK